MSETEKENGYTTISVRPATKARLDRAKIIPEEPYDRLLNRLLDEAMEEPAPKEAPA